MANCIHAKRIYTGKKIVENAYLVFDGAKLQGVSTKKTGKVVGRYDTITPAFIDPHSHIGMLRQGEPGAEAEANEHLDSMMTLPDALDSVQMDDAVRARLERGQTQQKRRQIGDPGQRDERHQPFQASSCEGQAR